MRLENLYSNFGTASPEDQAAYMSVYRLRRAEDMAKPSTYPKKKSTVGRSKIDLSESEKALAKVLGLTQKDMLTLRASMAVTEESSDDTSLLADPVFEEEE